MKVIIIKAGKNWDCPWCNKLDSQIQSSNFEDWLKERNIELETIEIQKGTLQTKELKELYGLKSVPFVVFLDDGLVLDTHEYFDGEINEFKDWVNGCLV